MSKKLIRRAMPAAIEDLKYWKLQSDKKYQRIKTIIEQLCVNPTIPSPKNHIKFMLKEEIYHH
jgi:Txe/YoeB family toxin of Txe-Axe toxin-antitoxin module